MEYILFHSKECPHCVRFLDELQKSGVENHVRVRKIENAKVFERYNIESVPTLLTPTKQKLEGGEVFQWLHEQQGQVAQSDSASQNKKYLRYAIYILVGLGVGFFVYKRVLLRFLSSTDESAAAAAIEEAATLTEQ